MNALLAALLLLQAAPAQSEAEKAEAAIKKFGVRKYKMLTQGKEAGTMVLQARVETEGGAKVVVLHLKGDSTIEGKVDGGTIDEKTTLEGLRLLSVRTRTADGKVDEGISIKDGQATVTPVDGEVKTVKVTGSTIGFAAMFLIACVQEQKAGSTFKVDILHFKDLQKDHEFRCVAKETIEIGGKKYDSFKWEQKGKGTIDLPDEDITYKIENFWWISPDGYLLRMTTNEDGKVLNDMILDAK